MPEVDPTRTFASLHLNPSGPRGRREEQRPPSSENCTVVCVASISACFSFMVLFCSFWRRCCRFYSFHQLETCTYRAMLGAAVFAILKCRAVQTHCLFQSTGDQPLFNPVHFLCFFCFRVYRLFFAGCYHHQAKTWARYFRNWRRLTAIGSSSRYEGVRARSRIVFFFYTLSLRDESLTGGVSAASLVWDVFWLSIIYPGVYFYFPLDGAGLSFSNKGEASLSLPDVALDDAFKETRTTPYLFANPANSRKFVNCFCGCRCFFHGDGINRQPWLL